MTKYLHEVVITAIVVKDGKYLITRRSKNKKRFPGMWTVPGGHLEVEDYINLPKDTKYYWYNVLEKVLRREIKEEVGINIKNIEYVTSLATVQYARDERDNITSGFWKPIKPEDKEIDSKYNTYLYKGLPSFPITNPGLDAIDAVLNPAETECLYYLHDANRQIHCAKTFEEHKENIKKYL